MHSIRSSIFTPPDLLDQIDHYYERLQQARTLGELKFIESQLKNFLTIGHEEAYPNNNSHHSSLAGDPAVFHPGRSGRSLP